MMLPGWPTPTKNDIPSFVSYRLGAVLAYKLCDFGSTMHGREKLEEITRGLPDGSTLLLCFGEIDCRMHLVKQAQKQQKSFEEVAAECAHRYFSQIVVLKKKFKIIVWGVVPSTPSEVVLDPRYPHCGTSQERNGVSRLFNRGLERLAREHGVGFVSLFDHLLLDDGSTNPAYYIDQVHLSQRAMPLAVREFQKVFPSLRVRLFKNALLTALPESLQFFLFQVSCEINTALYLAWTKSKQAVKKLVRPNLHKETSGTE